MSEIKLASLNQNNSTAPHGPICYILSTVSIVGCLANVMTFIILTRPEIRIDFNRIILVVLRHQCFIDSLVCLAGTLVMAFDAMWSSGSATLDVIICHTWHNQLIYWFLVFVSAQNLVMIAFERYYAVCRPFQHQRITVQFVRRWILASYLLGAACLSMTATQTKIAEGRCVSEYLITGKAGKIWMSLVAVILWFTMFSIPASLVTFLYARVVLTLRKRQATSRQSAPAIGIATKQLTRTAIVVTVIFIISLSYDLNYYVLGYFGATTYKLGETKQKIGMWLAMFNSFANPFVYILFLPVFRQRIKGMFNCWKTSQTTTETSV